MDPRERNPQLADWGAGVARVFGPGSPFELSRLGTITRERRTSASLSDKLLPSERSLSRRSTHCTRACRSFLYTGTSDLLRARSLLVRSSLTKMFEYFDDRRFFLFRMTAIFAGCVLNLRRRGRGFERLEELSLAGRLLPSLLQSSMSAGSILNVRASSSGSTTFQAAQGGIPRCAQLEIQLGTVSFTFYLCVWKTLFCRTCIILRNRRLCNHEA